ncbi:unnamed protein product [Dracunculus medinensis]|uniref:Multifunctional methyltransferase subunit TRM112-like protein n=1 Tax=Dracunculus medinensis TaxID=318479 RepID=A0A0N4UK51_DRAME|nr:unnamed protein product [Dracunculus medinensis]
MVKEHEYNENLVKGLLEKLNYPVLREAAESIGEANGLPAQLPTIQDEPFLRKLFHVLMSVEIIEGELKCPESGHVFPIRSGIPNMIVETN